MQEKLSAFSAFPTMFLEVFFPRVVKSLNWAVMNGEAVIMDKFKLLFSGTELNLSQTSPGFYVSAVQVGRKLVTSNFSFSYSVFYPF